MSENFRRLEEPDAQVQHRTTCGCGQELDVCSRGHCPRCGHRIEAPQLLTIG